MAEIVPASPATDVIDELDITTGQAVKEALAFKPTPSEKDGQMAALDSVIEELSLDPVTAKREGKEYVHPDELHIGADPLDVDMSYCPVCNAIMLARKQKELLG